MSSSNHTHKAHNFRLPKSPQDLSKISNDIISRPMGGSVVARLGNGVLIKYGGWDLAEEVLCTRFARDKTSLPVPRILHHPGSLYRRENWADTSPGAYFFRIPSVWYFCVEEVRGVSLDTVVDTMSTKQHEDVAEQLKSILSAMQVLKPKTLGSVTGGSYRNMMCVPPLLQPKQAFSTMAEFRDYIHFLMTQCGRPQQEIDELLACIPLNCGFRFAHGDLLPKNIMVDGSKITGIIDWQNAGFWPDFWEYCRMHDSNFETRGWSKVLKIVFPGEGRPKEVQAIHRMLINCSWFLF